MPVNLESMSEAERLAYAKCAPVVWSVDISAAELHAIMDTPKQIVPPPGAGFANQITAASIVYHGGATPFTNASAPCLIYQGMASYYIFFENSFPEATDDVFCPAAFDSSMGYAYPLADVANKAVMFTDLSTNWAAGDGTITVTVVYQVMPAA